MTTLLSAISTSAKMIWGNTNFGIGNNYGRPALFLFGFPIYFYALIIVTGMCLAILIGGLYFKKRGYDPYDITIYALVIIPLGVLGARLYVYIFPWAGGVSNWSTFFDFRSGGLGIYGGVILGYLSAIVCSKIKKQDFRIVADCIMPGLFLAQSMGRWGNYANQEAYGNLITKNFEDMINFWGSNSDHGFNGLAVWIDAAHDTTGNGAGWYQATFFYESVCTFLGFLICVLVLMRSKHYKLGWCSAFYGIYYGIVRLVIEGMRSDSLYLYIGTRETDIKISQLVSIVTIIMGLLLLSRIYRKQLHALYAKLFKNERQQLSVSRWVLLGVSVLSLALAVVMFVLGGESKFIVGFFASLVCVYSALGIWALCDRLKLYCKTCNERSLPKGGWQTEHDKHFVASIVYSVVAALLLALGLFSLVKWGIVDKISNGVVLAVAAAICCGVIVYFKVIPSVRKLAETPQTDYDDKIEFSCGETARVKPNTFLLFVFPPKVYADYGVENLKPWVEPDDEKKKKKSKKKKATEEKAETEVGDAAEVAAENDIANAPTENGTEKENKEAK